MISWASFVDDVRCPQYAALDDIELGGTGAEIYDHIGRESLIDHRADGTKNLYLIEAGLEAASGHDSLIIVYVFVMYGHDQHVKAALFRFCGIFIRDVTLLFGDDGPI